MNTVCIHIENAGREYCVWRNGTVDTIYKRTRRLGVSARTYRRIPADGKLARSLRATARTAGFHVEQVVLIDGGRATQWID